MLHGRPEKDWAQSAVFYQIYPMGFCGAPFENDGVAVNRIQKVKEWIPHLEKLGIGAIYFSPVFESDTHGYDTRISPRCLSRTPTATTPGIIQKSTAAWAPTRNLRRSARLCTRRASGWCWTGCSTMWAGASGPSRT